MKTAAECSDGVRPDQQNWSSLWDSGETGLQLLWCRKQFDHSKLYWSQPDEQENRFTVTSSKLPTDTKKCVCVCFFSPFNANQLHWNQHVIWINTHTRYLRSHDPTTRYVTSHRFTEVKCNKPEPDPDPDPVPGLSSLVLWGHCI